MNTGLSFFFILAVVCLILMVIITSLAMAQPFDKAGCTKAGKYLIIAVAAIAVVAIVAIAVVRAAMGGGSHSSGNPSGTGNNPTVTQQPIEEPDGTNAAKYKTPTQDASHWQTYTAEQYAQEDVSVKDTAYQFVGSLIDESRQTYLLINLYEDGFARIFQYAGETRTYEYNGYWRNRDDESVYFGVSNYVYRGESNPAYGLEQGDIATVDYSYELTAQDGIFSFGCNFCLGFADGGQFVRSTMIEGDGNPAYTAVADFEEVLPDMLAEATGKKPADNGSSESGDNQEGSVTAEYPANTFLLAFTPDTSEQLQTTFSCESSVWGPALGQSGSYTAAESSDVLFSWSNTAESYKLDFLADGTYQYQFTTMGVTETGTWTFEGWKVVTISPNGTTTTAERVEG